MSVCPRLLHNQSIEHRGVVDGHLFDIRTSIDLGGIRIVGLLLVHYLPRLLIRAEVAGT